jgi:hypothetical protein
MMSSSFMVMVTPYMMMSSSFMVMSFPCMVMTVLSCNIKLMLNMNPSKPSINSSFSGQHNLISGEINQLPVSLLPIPMSTPLPVLISPSSVHIDSSTVLLNTSNNMSMFPHCSMLCPDPLILMSSDLIMHSLLTPGPFLIIMSFIMPNPASLTPHSCNLMSKMSKLNLAVMSSSSVSPSMMVVVNSYSLVTHLFKNVPHCPF